MSTHVRCYVRSELQGDSLTSSEPCAQFGSAPHEGAAKHTQFTGLVRGASIPLRRLPLCQRPNWRDPRPHPTSPSRLGCAIQVGHADATCRA